MCSVDSSEDLHRHCPSGSKQNRNHLPVKITGASWARTSEMALSDPSGPRGKDNSFPSTYFEQHSQQSLQQMPPHTPGEEHFLSTGEAAGQLPVASLRDCHISVVG